MAILTLLLLRREHLEAGLTVVEDSDGFLYLVYQGHRIAAFTQCPTDEGIGEWRESIRNMADKLVERNLLCEA
jgi:hypothetical protein